MQTIKINPKKIIFKIILILLLNIILTLI